MSDTCLRDFFYQFNTINRILSDRKKRQPEINKEYLVNTNDPQKKNQNDYQEEITEEEDDGERHPYKTNYHWMIRIR